MTGNPSMRAPILTRHLIYSYVKGVCQSAVSKRAGFRDVNQLQLQFLYPERFYLVILRNGEGSCRSNNKRFNYLYDVGLGPASTKNSIPIRHVEQAGLFPTTRSLRPLPCNPVCESRACPPCIFLAFNIVTGLNPLRYNGHTNDRLNYPWQPELSTCINLY